MKIALVNNLYFPYNRGGAETVVRNQIGDLKRMGHEVFLISCRPKAERANGTEPSSDLKIYYLKSDYSRLAEFSGCHRFFWHISDIFSCRKKAAIKKILIAEKPGLVITHNIMGLGLRLPSLLRKLKIRHEHYLHDIQLLHPSGLMMFGREKIIDSLGAKFYQLFTRAFFASPAKIISPSYWLLGQHRQRGFFHDSEAEIKNFAASGSNGYIENNSDAGDNGNGAAADPESFLNFLFVGQIEKHKGILLLIEAFQEAQKMRPEIKLTVAGDGSIMSEAKKLAADNPQINFAGRLEPAGIKDLMAESDCLVVPSLCYENTPMTIHEAHSAGLSVLAAKIGGIPEIINKNDRLFNPGDVQDLKNKILEK